MLRIEPRPTRLIASRSCGLTGRGVLQLCRHLSEFIQCPMGTSFFFLQMMCLGMAFSVVGHCLPIWLRRATPIAPTDCPHVAMNLGQHRLKRSAVFALCVHAWLHSMQPKEVLGTLACAE